ncbi:MAG: cytochrome peroxidase [Myxococcaceae bacterium]|nr:cytochrome peroxidase [Myxococcaceae bacterium]
MSARRIAALVSATLVLTAACGGRPKTAQTQTLAGSATNATNATNATTPTNATSATTAKGRPPALPPPGPLSLPRSPHQVGLPVKLTKEAIPSDNPQTPDKIALGHRLFFDPRLSVDGTVACASCHDPRLAFTDARPTSIGVEGRMGQRNSPTILNALYNATQFWDGRVTTLEQQAALPIVNPVEMGQPSDDAAVAAIASDPTYRDAFQSAFARAPNAADLERAIASYERTQIAFDSPFDHYIAGEKSAVGDDAKRGWELFNTRARCNKCHALTDTKRDTTNLIDKDFHNIGVFIVRHDVVGLAHRAERLVASGDAAAIDRAAIETDMSALGRFLVTKKQADIASFKTPNIRNVLVTAPYFHDGSHPTLWDVMDHYNKGAGVQDPWLDQDMQPLALSEKEIDDVVAFMASLTSPEYAELGRTELARQTELARVIRPQRDTKRAFGPKPVQPKPPPR